MEIDTFKRKFKNMEITYKRGLHRLKHQSLNLQKLDKFYSKYSPSGLQNRTLTSNISSTFIHLFRTINWLSNPISQYLDYKRSIDQKNRKQLEYWLTISN
jgi:hypothetical protein